MSKVWVRIALSVVVLTVLSACATVRTQEPLHFTGLESPSRQFSGVLTLPKGDKAPFPLIDPDRVAIMGFSLGGHLSVSVSLKNVVKRWMGPDQPGFCAHVGFYPVCRMLEEYFDARAVTGAPILILAGELDSWGDGEACPEFAARLNEYHPGIASLTIYPNVHHAFDRAGSRRGYAPYARNQTAILQKPMWYRFIFVCRRNPAVC